jgi:hypothetical protein
MLLAAVDRAAAPTSKVQLGHWYRKTILTRLLPASPAQLSSKAFWNHMDRISDFPRGNSSRRIPALPTADRRV